VACYSPAFDVTPASYIRGLITEEGVVAPVNAEQIPATLNKIGG
ncbi:MAG: S-methyl-5-thioribose-1-phosphate isomerase, partial [Planctomycetota bacterium]